MGRTGVIKAHPFRDRFSKWPVALALYDGRTCPECGAVVCTWQARKTHEEWHDELNNWCAEVDKAVRRIAKHVGLPVARDPDEELETLRPNREEAPERPPLNGIVVGGEAWNPHQGAGDYE